MKCNFHSPLVVLAEGAASGESPSQGITGFCEFNLRTLSSKENIASSTYSDYCGNSKCPYARSQLKVLVVERQFQGRVFGL